MLRYHITSELFHSFTKEQLALQVSRMRTTGRYIPPAGPYVIRAWIGAIDAATLRERMTRDGRPPDYSPIRSDIYLDIEMLGEDVTCYYKVERLRFVAISAHEKSYLKTSYTNDHPGMPPLWWTGNGTMNLRNPIDLKMGTDEIDWVRMMRDTLVVALWDRSVIRTEIEPQKPSAKWLRSGLGEGDPFSSDKETVLHCPGRIYTGEHGGTHASPRMHFRAEHLRSQPYGKDRAMRKGITIDSQWVNAVDLDPNAPPETPLRAYKLTL